MTSWARSFGVKKDGLTRFLKPDSPCYNDTSISGDRLFPFKYTNGILDISYEGNSFKAQMVDITGNAPENETETVCSIMGGPRLVTGLGNNFKEYIRAWRDSSIDANSPIELFQPSQVIRVQEVDARILDANSIDSYTISEVPPSGDTYTSGTNENNYDTTFVFKTPLTFTILEGGVTKYITFRTSFDQE